MDASKIIVEESNVPTLPLHNFAVNLPTGDQTMTGSMQGYSTIPINQYQNYGPPTTMTLTAIINELQNENRGEMTQVAMQEMNENRELFAVDMGLQAQLGTDQKRECIALECTLEPRKGSQLCEKHSKQRSRGKQFELKPGNVLKKRGRPPKPMDQCKAKKQKKYYLRKKLQTLGESLETIAEICTDEKPSDPAPKEEVLKKIGENLILYFKTLPANSPLRTELIYAACEGLSPVDAANAFGIARKPQREKTVETTPNNNNTVTTTVASTSLPMFPETHTTMAMPAHLQSIQIHPSIQALPHSIQNIQMQNLQAMHLQNSLQGLQGMPVTTLPTMSSIPSITNSLPNMQPELKPQ